MEGDPDDRVFQQGGEYEGGETMATPQKGSTFSSIALEPEVIAEQEFHVFVKGLINKLVAVKQERFTYYDDLRRNSSRWANGSRWILAALGGFAFLLTAIAAALRFTWPDAAGYDKPALLAVLATYAVMGAISFYEKGTDKTGAYFRHLGIILTIRDLWTRFQFQILKELMSLKGNAAPEAESTARERIRALAEAFCNDLDNATSGELDQWRTKFLTSLSELEQVVKPGTENVTRQLQDSIKAAEKAPADVKAPTNAAEGAAGS